MIKINELRMDGLFYDSDGNIGRIGQMESDGSYCEGVFYYDTDQFKQEPWNLRFETIKPIPLSPEILQKFGFIGKYKSCGWEFIHQNYALSFRLSSQDEDDYGNPIQGYVFHVRLNYSSCRPIYFLHHLQSLFLDHTGEELTYTP